MEKRNLTCIGCPMGCALEVTLDDGGNVLSVTGNTCPNGDKYARKEVTNPTRIVTSSVRVSGSSANMKTVSCKTREDIPKDRIFDVIRDIKDVVVPCPVHIGDVVKANVAGTGVDMIATKDAV